MAETVIQENYAEQVPVFPKRFELPKDFGKAPEAPKPEIKQQPAAPAAAPAAPAPETAKPASNTESEPVTEGAENDEQAEPLTTAKEPEKPGEKEQPSSRRFERRIDRATKARAEAEAKAEALAREVAELKAKQAPPVDPNEPKMADFMDIEEYAKAKATYAVKQESKAREEKQQ